MNITQFSNGKIVSVLATLWLLSNAIIGPILVEAKTVKWGNRSFKIKQVQSSLILKKQAKNLPDRDLGRPPSRTSGGGRGSCLKQLIALVPGDEKVDVNSETCAVQSKAKLAYTSGNPMLWFYIPSTYSDPKLSAKFVLIDEGKKIATQSIPLSENEGIMCISLRHSLALNNGYRWSFSVVLNPEKDSENPKVGGLIQRGSQQSELWHDKLSLLAKLRFEDRKDSEVATEWNELLSSQGLEAISGAPIVSSCNASASPENV